jgi:hypothetical protein
LTVGSVVIVGKSVGFLEGIVVGLIVSVGYLVGTMEGRVVGNAENVGVMELDGGAVGWTVAVGLMVLVGADVKSVPYNKKKSVALRSLSVKEVILPGPSMLVRL